MSTANTTTLTLKNVPLLLHERLKENAKRHRRSINQEAMHCLEQVLWQAEPNAEGLLREARAVRAKLAHFQLTPKEISAAKRAGRS